LNSEIDPGSVDVDQSDREQKLRERRQKELSGPEVKELKKASLEFFDNWRMKVMERVGTVVNSKETASSQMKTTPAPKPTKHSAPDKKINPETTRSQDVTPDSVLTALYPPVSTQLSFLEEPTKILIVHSILLIYVFGWVVALVMWGFAIVWLFFALASISRSKFPFNMGWWGFTFPLGMLTVSTTTIGKETGSRFFNVLGTVWEYRLSYTLSSAVLLPLVLISPPFTTIPSC